MMTMLRTVWLPFNFYQNVHWKVNKLELLIDIQYKYHIPSKKHAALQIAFWLPIPIADHLQNVKPQ